MKIKLTLVTWVLLALAALVPHTASAQMDIEELVTDDQPTSKISFPHTLKRVPISCDFTSPARERHERQMIRKKRNKLEITSGLQGSMTNLSESWIETSGGDNTVTLLASFLLKHTYSKDLFSLSTMVACKFGYYHMMLDEELESGEIVGVPTWYKNQDEIKVSVTPSYKMSKYWSYGATINFRSQFAKGYLSSSLQEDYNLKSRFMAPGYLDVSGGLIYKSPNKKLPFTVNISPLALSAVYVTSPEVRENAQHSYKDPEAVAKKYVEPYGVSPYSSSKYEGGSSLEVKFDRFFGKNNFLRYDTKLYAFYGWMTQLTHKNTFANEEDFDAAMADWNKNKDGIKPMLSLHPMARWENSVTIKASKFISTTLSYQMYYNRAQNSKIQSQTLLSVGLSYTFRNK